MLDGLLCRTADGFAAKTRYTKPPQPEKEIEIEGWEEERDEGSFVRIILRSYYVFCVRFNNVIAFFGEHREFESG